MKLALGSGNVCEAKLVEKIFNLIIILELLRNGRSEFC